MSDNLVNIQNLSLNFSTRKGPLLALRNINLEIPRKKVVGLVGESGCGKSTLAAAVIRLLAPNATIHQGRIEFEGHNLLEFSESQIRTLRGDRISMVFQDPMTSLNPVLSIDKQMKDIQHRKRCSTKEKRRVSVEMLEKIGIPDAHEKIQDFPHQFSGGMRQRIAIAMALMSRPALLIADEPTTALDATLEMQIVDLLKALQSDIGCSILFVSHNLGVVAELCDLVIVMYAGVALEKGTVRDIFQTPGHPYTQALQKCDPARIRKKTRQLPTIPGSLPDLIKIWQGCIYKDRCAQAMPECDHEEPGAYALSSSHIVRCHLLRH